MTQHQPLRPGDHVSALEVTTITCQYVQPKDESQPPRPTGLSVSEQCTRFLQRNDAWPVAQAMHIPPAYPSADGEHMIMSQVLTVTWLPRVAWEYVQSRIMANAMAIVEQRKRKLGDIQDEREQRGDEGSEGASSSDPGQG